MQSSITTGRRGGFGVCGPGHDREPVFILPQGRTKEDVVAAMQRHRTGVVERLAEQEGISYDAAKARIASLQTEVR